MLFGYYEVKDNKTKRKKKIPIEWIELDESKDEKLLLSKECIGFCDYAHLNEYLQNDMMKYFDQDQKSKIKQIYILNQKELFHYFPTPNSRQAKVLDFIKESGILVSDGTYGPKENTWYLIQPDDPEQQFIPAINLYGELRNDGVYVRHVPCGIRVALKITK